MPQLKDLTAVLLVQKVSIAQILQYGLNFAQMVLTLDLQRMNVQNVQQVCPVLVLWHQKWLAVLMATIV